MGEEAVRMKILLLGATGQVGWELQRSLSPLGELVMPSHSELDFMDAEQMSLFVADCSPDVIVNAAAYTAVDKAEDDSLSAYKVNCEAVGRLAELCFSKNIWLIHYSTDYVFDGEKRSEYLESDETSPLGVYGKSKLQGERAVQASGCKYLIFRTSWVYGARGNNFAKTMIRLGKEQNQLNVVSDQIGAPTSAELIADVTSLCLFKVFQDECFGGKASGVYHLASQDYTSWHGFAKFLISKAGAEGIALRAKPADIVAIEAKDFPTLAKRPQNSRLNTQKLRSTFNVELPSWQTHAVRLISELSDRI